MFPEPSFEENDPSPLPLATQPELEEHIIRDAHGALDNADDAVKEMNVCDEWRETVQNVHWVMKTMENVADVRPQTLLSLYVLKSLQIHPFARVAWDIISLIPEVPPGLINLAF